MIAFRPSDALRQRVAELSERLTDGNISTEERSELEDYFALEHIMIMAKARERQYAKIAFSEIGEVLRRLVEGTTPR